MQPIQEAKVVSILDKLSFNADKNSQILQDLKHDILRYEQILLRYQEFKSAEDMLFQERSKLVTIREQLDKEKKELTQEREYVQRETSLFEDREAKLNGQRAEASAKELLVSKALDEARAKLEEVNFLHRNADSRTQVLGNWERKLGERESLFSQRWAALTALMETKM